VNALASRGGLPPQAVDLLPALAGPIDNGVESFTHSQVARIVQSQAFADAWVQANRVAHDELVKALTGQGDTITVQGDAVSVDLAAFIQTV
jgi:hypothetical protein